MCVIPPRPPRKGFDVGLWLDWEVTVEGVRHPVETHKTTIRVKASTEEEACKEAALQYYRGLLMKVRAAVLFGDGSSTEYFWQDTTPPQGSKHPLEPGSPRSDRRRAP